MKSTETVEAEVSRYNGGMIEKSRDNIVREEPLEIFINGEKKYFCMRMPGMDRELSIGLLYNEGIIGSLNDIESFEVYESQIIMNIKKDAHQGIKKIYSSSGCMYSDDLIRPISQEEGSFNADELSTLQKKFFSMQNIFEKTGGVHSTAFFSRDGNLISFAEDVGRHNAVDKCMGNAIISGRGGEISLILLSSRISFEMIKKCFRTGAVIVAGISAPTSAAINTAAASDITLIGFLRGGKFNIYCHPERIIK